MGLRSARRRKLRAASGARARLVRQSGARQRRVGARWCVPRADCAPRLGAAGSGIDRRYRPGLRVPVWRRRHDPPRLTPGRKAERPDFRPAARRNTTWAFREFRRECDYFFAAFFFLLFFFMAMIVILWVTCFGGRQVVN